MTTWLIVLRPGEVDRTFTDWVEADTARDAAERYLDGSVDVGETILVAAGGNVHHFTREDSPRLVEVREADRG